MAVRIRLRRIGRKKQPSYRLVAAESTNARSGAYLETLGFYNPRTQPAELRVELERVDFWLANGATLSDTADSLVRKARRGGDSKVRMISNAQEPTASVVALPEPTSEAAAEAESKPARGRKSAAKSGTVEAAAAADVAEAAAPAAGAEEPAAEATEAAAPAAEVETENAAPAAEAETPTPEVADADAPAAEGETAEDEKPAAG